MNKNSARVATFAVRPCGGRVARYTYTSKRDQRAVTAHKFEVWLVGNNPQDYCIGFVKGSVAECNQAKMKYTDDTVWTLSKVSLDTYTAGTYISTPIPCRVDLAKSKMTIWDAGDEDDIELRASMPKHPVPPRSVADVARITTNRSTDLIAMIKEVSTQKRKSKSDEEIVDVELLDNSMTKQDKLASIVVSVFGTRKVEQLKHVVGKPMAFFNLSVVCAGRGCSPQINHYSDELMEPAPECEKTASLRAKQQDLAAATNTDKLTAVWTPNLSRDVSGRQALSCAAFLDYTSETPEAALPEVVQLMWVHIEEPDSDGEVLDSSGGHIWYRAALRDVSGSVPLGIPQRCAFVFAGCSTKEEFSKKHAAGELNLPLLCHARVSRSVRTKDGASQSVTYVNHTLETVEPVSWAALSAPNAAYTDVLGILNNCPEHDEGILFAFLADIQPDPYYGMRVVYDGQEGPKGLYLAALVACNSKSKTDKVGGDGYKVVTSDVKDVANPGGTVDNPIGSHTLVGYCSMDSLPGFRLDPPRGKNFRVAVVLFTKADEKEGLHIHKLEYIEPEQVKEAVLCMQKLRRLSKCVHTVSTEKRSHSVALVHEGMSPCTTKRARTLQAVPTEASLPGYDP